MATTGKGLSVLGGVGEGVGTKDSLKNQNYLGF